MSIISHQYLQLFYTNTLEYHHQQAETFWLLFTLLCGLREKAADSISVLHQLHVDVEALCEFHSSLCSVIHHTRLLTYFLFSWKSARVCHLAGSSCADKSAFNASV